MIVSDSDPSPSATEVQFTTFLVVSQLADGLTASLGIKIRAQVFLSIAQEVIGS